MGMSTVGITAGASAPEVLVDDVIEALRRLGRWRSRSCRAGRKRSEFRLPPELAKAFDVSYRATPEQQERQPYGASFPQGNADRRIPAQAEALGPRTLSAGVDAGTLVPLQSRVLRCGKIDYPDAILNRRLSVKECLDAVDECGAPMVAIRAASR